MYVNKYSILIVYFKSVQFYKLQDGSERNYLLTANLFQMLILYLKCFLSIEHLNQWTERGINSDGRVYHLSNERSSWVQLLHDMGHGQ